MENLVFRELIYCVALHLPSQCLTLGSARGRFVLFSSRQMSLSILASFLKSISFFSTLVWLFLSQGAWILSLSPKIIFPNWSTSDQMSPQESCKGSEMRACVPRLSMVLCQAWGPRAHDHLASSLQATRGFMVSFGEVYRRNEWVPCADTHTHWHVHVQVPSDSHPLLMTADDHGKLDGSREQGGSQVYLSVPKVTLWS